MPCCIDRRAQIASRKMPGPLRIERAGGRRIRFWTGLRRFRFVRVGRSAGGVVGIAEFRLRADRYRYCCDRRRRSGSEFCGQSRSSATASTVRAHRCDTTLSRPSAENALRQWDRALEAAVGNLAMHPRAILVLVVVLTKRADYQIVVDDADLDVFRIDTRGDRRAPPVVHFRRRTRARARRPMRPSAGGVRCQSCDRRDRRSRA